jgi:hypothetical protein
MSEPGPIRYSISVLATGRCQGYRKARALTCGRTWSFIRYSISVLATGRSQGHRKARALTCGRTWSFIRHSISVLGTGRCQGHRKARVLTSGRTWSSIRHSISIYLQPMNFTQKCVTILMNSPQFKPLYYALYGTVTALCRSHVLIGCNCHFTVSFSLCSVPRCVNINAALSASSAPSRAQPCLIYITFVPAIPDDKSCKCNFTALRFINCVTNYNRF